MRSSFLSFAPDVSKEQCQAEHWIDIENVSESVKMTPEEIENLNARILRTSGTEMHDLKNEAFAKEERVVYDKWCGNFLSFGIQGINWTVRDAQNCVKKCSYQIWNRDFTGVDQTVSDGDFFSR